MVIKRIRVDEHGRVQTFFGQQQPKQKGGATNSRSHLSRKHFSTVNRSENKNPEIKQPECIPELAPGNIRIIPLGGVEEVGKNMTAVIP